MYRFVQDADHFSVEEELFYPPSGNGEHIFAQIRKRNMSTHQAKRRLSEMTGVPLRQIDHAGMKDTLATATQWLSWPEKAQRQAPVDQTDLAILNLSHHDHRLGIGQVKANHFRLLLEGEGDLPTLQQLGRPFANFYGRQRFGATMQVTLSELLQGLGKNRQAVSVAQSRLFNAFLHARLDAHGWRAETDDYWTATNGKRWFQDTEDPELGARYDRGEIAPTAPVFGYKIPLREEEGHFLEGLGMKQEDFRRFGKMAKGARRPIRVTPTNVAIKSRETGCELSLSLPSGAYATVFLSQAFTSEPFDLAFDRYDFREFQALGSPDEIRKPNIV